MPQLWAWLTGIVKSQTVNPQVRLGLFKIVTPSFWHFNTGQTPYSMSQKTYVTKIPLQPSVITAYQQIINAKVTTTQIHSGINFFIHSLLNNAVINSVLCIKMQLKCYGTYTEISLIFWLNGLVHLLQEGVTFHTLMGSQGMPTSF